jgi:hypothetical protein
MENVVGRASQSASAAQRKPSATRLRCRNFSQPGTAGLAG